MGLFDGAIQNMANTIDTMYNLPKSEQTKAEQIAQKLGASVKAMKAHGKIEEAVAKKVKDAAIGLSEKQAKAMQMMVFTQMKPSGKPAKPGASTASSTTKQTQQDIQNKIREITNEVMVNKVRSSDKQMKAMTDYLKG